MTITAAGQWSLQDALREETDLAEIGREFSEGVQELVEESRAEARAAGRQYRLIHRLWQPQEEARGRRHRLARRNRRVWVEPREDGRAQLCALLDAATAHAIQDRIETPADRSNSVPSPGSPFPGSPLQEFPSRDVPPQGSEATEWTSPDTGDGVPSRRTLPQMRADVLADLRTGAPDLSPGVSGPGPGRGPHLATRPGPRFSVVDDRPPF